jgi:hypothetical protein
MRTAIWIAATAALSVILYVMARYVGVLSVIWVLVEGK